MAATCIVGLQSWILLEIIALKVKVGKYEERLESHEFQLGRIVSDIESEKGTRKRLNDDVESRLRTIEHIVDKLKCLNP